jgi:hypothetical protein
MKQYLINSAVVFAVLHLLADLTRVLVPNLELGTQSTTLGFYVSALGIAFFPTFVFKRKTEAKA